MKLSYAKKEDSPALYIQCKGLHSGRPLKEYIPNCFSVFSDDPNIFAKCFTLWKTQQYRTLIRGSVVPFITIVETRKLFQRSFPLLDKKCPKRIVAVQKIEDAISIKENEIQLYRQLQYALATELVKPS